jgi:hypothetical protein
LLASHEATSSFFPVPHLVTYFSNLARLKGLFFHVLAVIIRSFFFQILAVPLPFPIDFFGI